jgi:hypothetical protein
LGSFKTRSIVSILIKNDEKNNCEYCRFNPQNCGYQPEDCQNFDSKIPDCNIIFLVVLLIIIGLLRYLILLKNIQTKKPQLGAFKLL